MYADGTHIYGYCRLGEARLERCVSECMTDVAIWMRSSGLQLSNAKSEVLWRATSRRQRQIPTTPLATGNDSVLPAVADRDLGIDIDADLSMRTHS